MKKIDEIKKMINLVRNINESLESDKNLLVEANPLGMVAREGAITAKMLEPLLKDLMVAGRKEATLLTSIGVKDSNGLLKLIQNDFKFVDKKLGTLAAKEASSVRGGLELSILKNTSGINKELMEVAASNLVKDARFLETYKAYANEPDLVTALKTKGYSDQAAKELAKQKFRPSVPKIKPIPNTTAKPIDPNIPIPPQPVPKWWKFEWAKDKKWLKRALYVAGGATSLGAVYLAWKTFFGEDDDLPPCIKPLVTNEVEFEKYLTNGYVTMGKYTIYQDKKVKIKLSTGEELIGKWSYNKETQTIDANFNGKIVNVPCAPGAENPEPEKVKDQNSGIRYHDCTGTYTKGCKTDPTGAIGQVQQCLRLVVDGKFWNKTQAALVAKGFADGFKDSDIAKICGGTQTSTQQTEVNPYDNWEPNEPETGDDSINKQETDTTEG